MSYHPTLRERIRWLRMMLPYYVRRPFCRHQMQHSHFFWNGDGRYGQVRCCFRCAKRVVIYGDMDTPMDGMTT